MELKQVYYSDKLLKQITEEEKKHFSILCEELNAKRIVVRAFALTENEIKLTNEITADENAADENAVDESPNNNTLKDDNLQTTLFICAGDEEVEDLSKLPNIGYNTSKGKTILLSFEGINHEYLLRVFQRHHDIPWRILDTERTYLREMTLEDIDALYNLYENPGVTKYIDGLEADKNEQLQVMKAYIDNIYKMYEFGLWLIINKENNKVIGQAGLEIREINEQVLPKDREINEQVLPKDREINEQVVTEDREIHAQSEIEMGIIIHPDYQNLGYGKEVGNAVINYAFEYFELKKINYITNPDNAASVTLAKRLGFENQGFITIMCKQKATDMLYLCKYKKT